MEAFTILRRLGGKWFSSELNGLTKSLRTQVTQHISFPEYAILDGHFSEDQVVAILLETSAPYILTQITGTQNLPFDLGPVLSS